MTMGFRGEALAALASVARLELKTSDGKESTRVVASGGEIISVGICARNRGTSIEARDLFFNAPARLKFQKSPAACAAAVLKVVELLSLSHAEVHFRLHSNGKLTFEALPKEWKGRVEQIWGPLVHSLAFKGAGLSLTGLFGRPEEGKATRSSQVLFVNRRPIVSPLIAKAVKEGFGTRMIESLFPVFVLFLELPSDRIDVNVHPQKKEVRFREEGKLFTTVQRAVASMFETQAPEIAPMPWDFTTSSALSISFPEAPALSFTESPPLPVKMVGRPLAVLGNYLFIEEENWILVDLPGAEARILFEGMNRETPSSQILLWPLEMEVDTPEGIVELLRPLGIEARPLSKRKIAIDALALEMKEYQAIEFVRRYSLERKLAVSVTKLCRARNRNYPFEEGAMIWEKLQQCMDRTYDPLGKRILSPLSKEELAKRFEV
jgi:DNA mismatch repair ATPase MutL